MDHREKIKQLMPALRKRFDGMSVRLQPKAAVLEDVYEVHVRPQHAEAVTDLDWELKESGPLDLIAKSNGVFFREQISNPQPDNSNRPARRNVSKRPRRL